MKLRNGFVSNSSSSSFVVACREELTAELLLGHFKAKGHPMAWLMEGLAKHIVQHAERLEVPPKDKETYDNHVSEKVRALSEKFPLVYSFSASNEDGDSFSGMIYNEAARFKIEMKDLVIVGEYE